MLIRIATFPTKGTGTKGGATMHTLCTSSLRLQFAVQLVKVKRARDRRYANTQRTSNGDDWLERSVTVPSEHAGLARGIEEERGYRCPDHKLPGTRQISLLTMRCTRQSEARESRSCAAVCFPLLSSLFSFLCPFSTRIGYMHYRIASSCDRTVQCLTIWIWLVRREILITHGEIQYEASFVGRMEAWPGHVTEFPL